MISALSFACLHANLSFFALFKFIANFSSIISLKLLIRSNMSIYKYCNIKFFCDIHFWLKKWHVEYAICFLYVEKVSSWFLSIQKWPWDVFQLKDVKLSSSCTLDVKINSEKTVSFHKMKNIFFLRIFWQKATYSPKRASFYFSQN